MEYLSTVGSIVAIEGRLLMADLAELNICAEVAETSCGLLSLVAKAGHHIVKRLLVNIPMAIVEVSVPQPEVKTEEYSK
jgi:hypothetical protein